MALDLIAPQTPDGNASKGPELFLQGMGQGLAAFARFAEMKRNSENEILKLAQHERLAKEQTDLEREKMAADQDYREKALEVTRDLNAAHIGYYNSQADAFKNGQARDWQNKTAFNQQRETLVNEVNESAASLKLNDPEFATKEPVQYAANVMKFRDMYGLSPLTEVKNALTQFQRIADQQKINLKMGAKYDEDKGAWMGGETKAVPVWQIVKNLSDPLQQEATTNALEASGHFHVIQDFETINGVKVPRTSQELDPALKDVIDKGKDVKFERSPSRVPPAMLRSGSGRGTNGPTPMPDPDIPADDPQASNSKQPVFNQTDTDRTIAMAKAAIAKGASRDAVAQRLQEMGIDPADALAA